MDNSYRSHASKTATVKFEITSTIKNLENYKIFALIWTTTPWTLPSNTALTVGPYIEYALVSTFNQYTFEPINVILAKNLVGFIFYL
jgi:isoleucyl-tRNA synthetase